MGRIVDMPLPRLGETMEEGRIVTWFKQPGETFKRGEILLEVETDKTVVECPALVDGKLVEHLAKVADRVPIDSAIARIEIDAEHGPVVARADELRKAASSVAPPRRLSQPNHTGRIRASGKARAAARKMGIDLTGLKGTGRGGRVSAMDVQSSSTNRPMPTVVLIHGLFADSNSFSLLRLMLERSGFAVDAIDLPGHGASTETAENLEDAVAIVQRSLPTGDLILVGHSLGAIVATRIASVLNRRIKQLVLLSPAGFGIDINGAFIGAMLHATNEDQVIDALHVLGPAKVSRTFAAEQLRRVSAHREMLTRLVSSVADRGFQKIAITRDLAAFDIPVTAIFGRDDPIVPVHHALAAPSNVEVRIVAGCGHVPHWYQADFIASLLRK